jgi:hypothetical protein
VANQGTNAPAGTTYVAISGALPNAGAVSAPNIVAASGGYDFWYQATFVYSKALQSNASGLKTLADALVNSFNNSVALPASLAPAIADPLAGISIPVLPVADPTHPVNYYRPSGSCGLPVPAG